MNESPKKVIERRSYSVDEMNNIGVDGLINSITSNNQAIESEGKSDFLKFNTDAARDLADVIKTHSTTSVSFNESNLNGIDTTSFFGRKFFGK